MSAVGPLPGHANIPMYGPDLQASQDGQPSPQLHEAQRDPGWKTFTRDREPESRSNRGLAVRSAHELRTATVDQPPRGVLGQKLGLAETVLPKRPDRLLTRPIGETVTLLDPTPKQRSKKKAKKEDPPSTEGARSSGSTLGTFLGSTARGDVIVRKEGEARAQFFDAKQVRFPDPDAVVHPLDGVGPLRRPGSELKAVLQRILQSAEPGHLPASRYVEALFERGHAAYVVGGAVRDAIQSLDEPGKTPRDVDLATTALPKDIRATVKALANQGGQPVASPPFVDQFGAVLLGGDKLDLVSLKVADGSVAGGKHKAVFGVDLARDAKNRDFTMNAIYYDPVNDVVVDPTGSGVRDAHDRVLRLVDGADDAGASRAMRYFKFRLRGYEPAPGLKDDIRTMIEREWGSDPKFASAMARVSPRSARTPEAVQDWLVDFRKAMKKDGMKDLFDRYVSPRRDQITERVLARNAS